jgi:cytochrome c oxidase accessory protein FixG
MSEARDVREEVGGGRSSPFAVAPEEDLLYSLAQDGSRKWIDPVTTVGRFYRLRLVIGVLLIALFVGLPLVHIAGKPGILLDLTRRQFTLVGVTFHPTDNLLLLALAAALAVTVFAVTAVFGRLWCGYGCPQPVYLEFVYRPLERLFEGKQRRKLDRAGAGERAARQLGKWLSFLLVSVFLAATFTAYFVGWSDLVSVVVPHPGEHQGVLFTITLLAVAMAFDFAYFRDQMCTVACPYGRLQTVLYDQDTVIVGYDVERGEPRASRRTRADKEAELGDCVDCNRCVTTCPTGMDIRRGLQMECIGCAQCIEACDEVMARQGKPPGLIRYTSLRELGTGVRRFWRPRLALYSAVFLVSVVALVVLARGRPEAGVEVLRGGREAFRMLPNGQVANILRLRITNNLDRPQEFTVTATQPAGVSLVVSQSPFTVGPNEVATVEVVAELPESAFVRGQTPTTFVVQAKGGATFTRSFVLLGPG